MSRLDTADWDVAAQTRKADPGVIDLEATDITERDLSEEEPFPQDLARDRGPSNSDLHRFVSKIPYGPLRTLDSKRLTSKWQLFEQLTRTLPLNELNLPNFIYRPDLLDHNSIREALHSVQHAPLDAHGSTPTTSISSSPETRVDGTEFLAPSTILEDNQLETIQSQLEAAILPLTYHEGFPAFEDGTPFWRQLPTEESVAFEAFVQYLELGGARKRTDITTFPAETITEWFHVNFWTYRVKAFELYRVVDAQKQRLFRMLQTEDSHFKTAQRMFKQIDKVAQGTDFEEALMKLDPEKLISVLEKVVKIQRISVGLNANGGAVDAEDLRKSPTTNIIMQQIVKNTGESVKTEEDTPDLLLDAPDAIEQAQALIIATQQGQKLD